MDEADKIWMDGKLVGWKKANVHILTHTLHYGGGVFEGIRFYKTKKGPAVFRLNEHIDRLFFSAKSIHMKVPYKKEEIKKAILKTIKTNKVKQGYIRPLIYYGYGVMGLKPDKSPVNVAIAVWPWGKYLGSGKIKVKISDYIRIHPRSSITNAKICGHYVNSILATMQAKQAGCTEALLLDYEGNIAEGPGENIFLVKDSKLITPPAANILPGITRDSITKIALDQGLEVDEITITPTQLKEADEVFFTGTAAEITPINQVDDKVINNNKTGQITGQLQKIFYSIVNGENKRYENWLTYVK